MKKDNEYLEINWQDVNIMLDGEEIEGVMPFEYSKRTDLMGDLQRLLNNTVNCVIGEYLRREVSSTDTGKTELIQHGMDKWILKYDGVYLGYITQSMSDPNSDPTLITISFKRVI